MLYKCQLEYIWLDAKGQLRSKVRFIDFRNANITLAQIPVWNFDGSSTGQATTESSERFLRPVYMCKNPFFALTIAEHACFGMLVMCAVYNDHQLSKPSAYNHFHAAEIVFQGVNNTRPWFGFEQEFFLLPLTKDQKDQVEKEEKQEQQQGPFYCGVGAKNINKDHRLLMDSFTRHCLLADLSLYGTNAEVAPGQWEFQIGTVEGQVAAHELWIGRYILLKTAEMYAIDVCFDPKPFAHLNGSGCHTNFSNTLTRHPINGFGNINGIVAQLDKNHSHHMAHYGADNAKRLTGLHETSAMDTFSCSIGGRHTSVRIGYETLEKGCGYFEDRRPASNCDPYLVASLIVSCSNLN